MAILLQQAPWAVLVVLWLAVDVLAVNPHGVEHALDPRITTAPVLARQDVDSCWSSAPFVNCIGPYGPLSTYGLLCQQSSEASVYTSCACSTNSIMLPCWSSYCTADPTYSQELSEFQRDSTIFCGGGGGSPSTAPVGTKPTGAAGATSTSKTSGGAPTLRMGGALVALSAFVAAWLAASAWPS